MLQTGTKAQAVSWPGQGPAVRLGETNVDFGGVQGTVVGGVSHGKFENDFDWEQLGRWPGPRCDEVCRDPRRMNQCFPIKWNDHFGPPCGIVNPSNGCFNNQPTQTCALCTAVQPYCCLYEQIPLCDEPHPPSPPPSPPCDKEVAQGAPGGEPVALGLPNPGYGGLMGGVFGGYQHGHYDNDVNYEQLSTWSGPRCDLVCRDLRRMNQCFPIKYNGNFGPPCGVVTEGYGCFTNQPTQTCALCTPGVQPYCCPYQSLPLCEW